MHPETCPNCGTELRGTFCHECGQKDVDLDRPFFSLLGEWMGNLFAFDARVWRTLGPLLTKPGFLTAEYLQGRRASYVPPLRLYFFASVAMFLALAVSGHTIVRSSEDGEAPVRVYTTSGELEVGGFDDADPAKNGGNAEEGEEGEEAADFDDASGAGHWINSRMDRLDASPDTINSIYRQRLAQTLILLAFAFSVFTRALFWDRRLFHHLIFSMHLHAAAFLGIFAVNSVGRLVDFGLSAFGFKDWVTSALSLVFVLGLPFYIFLALRRVFGRGRLATLWRFLVLVVVYLVCLSIILIVTMLLTAVEL